MSGANGKFERDARGIIAELCGFPRALPLQSRALVSFRAPECLLALTDSRLHRSGTGTMAKS